MELRSILKGMKNKRKGIENDGEKDGVKPAEKVSKPLRRSKVVKSRLLKLRMASSRMSSSRSKAHQDGHEPVVPASDECGSRGRGKGRGRGNGRGKSAVAKEADGCGKTEARGRGRGRGCGKKGRGDGRDRNDEDRRFGCSRCRQTPTGCSQCRRPGYIARGKPGRPSK